MTQYLEFDSEEEARAYARTLQEFLEGMGLDCYVDVLPPGMLARPTAGWTLRIGEGDPLTVCQVADPASLIDDLRQALREKSMGEGPGAGSDSPPRPPARVGGGVAMKGAEYRVSVEDSRGRHEGKVMHTPVCYPSLAIYGLICWWLDELEKAGIKEVSKINRFYVGELNQALDWLMKAAQWRDDIAWFDGALPLDHYRAKQRRI